MYRRGREFYGKHYEEAIRLYDAGLSANEIAKKLGISYSCAYHWIRGLRKPEQGNVNNFVSFLQGGPKPQAEVEKTFPKHNELFLIASRRALPVRRQVIDKKYKSYATWYYLNGQEELLKEKIDELIKKVKEVKEKMKKAFDIQ